MKNALKKLFSPILNHFESGVGEYNYKKSYRSILIFMGSLFFMLSIVSLIASMAASQIAGFIPILVLFSVGLVCTVIGFLGSDRAVAKIWGNK